MAFPVMGKTKRKARPGTWVQREVFESRAFLSLKGFAPQLLILILAKRKIDNQQNCLNCDNLIMTYAELGNKYGITQPRATRAFDNLMEKGFIKVRHYGGKFQQDRNVYALSEKWRLWVPRMVCSTRKRDVHRGFQGKKRAR